MKRETSSIPPNSLTLPVAKRDHIQGLLDAPIVLLEYGDYECPYCGAAYPIIKSSLERLGEKLCFAFRNFPLVNSHPHAQHAAEAAEAAGAQGKFWEMHDMLFEHQEALDDEDIARYAKTAWPRCRSSDQRNPDRRAFRAGCRKDFPRWSTRRRQWHAHTFYQW